MCHVPTHLTSFYLVRMGIVKHSNAVLSSPLLILLAEQKININVKIKKSMKWGTLHPSQIQYENAWSDVLQTRFWYVADIST
jgi:hypothetical protein